LKILIFISPNISRKKWGKRNANDMLVSVSEKEEKERIAQKRGEQRKGGPTQEGIRKPPSMTKNLRK
jgi:hypothetical protein